MTKKERESPQPLPQPDFVFDMAERETTLVQQQLEAELAKWPMIHFLMRHFGSLLFHSSQRLIDLHKKTGTSTAQNEAVIESCVRLFSECYGGYALLRQGLIMQAIVLLRSTFEITTQAILFVQREEMALAWLQGRKIKPQRVRQLSSMPKSQRDLYDKLANLSHPNYEAFRYFSVPVPGSHGLAKAYIYGGWFAPREAGQIAIQYLWAQLVFLNAFYERYSRDLAAAGLLWSDQTVKEVFDGQANPAGYTWQTYLAFWREQLKQLTDQHAASLPDDYVDIALALSDYSPEQKEQWRAGWEQAEKDAERSRGQHT